MQKQQRRSCRETINRKGTRREGRRRKKRKLIVTVADADRIITGPPNRPVLFCTLSSVGVVYNARGRSAAAGPGAWPVRWPTLQGGTVRLRPVGHLVLHKLTTDERCCAAQMMQEENALIMVVRPYS